MREVKFRAFNCILKIRGEVSTSSCFVSVCLFLHSILFCISFKFEEHWLANHIFSKVFPSDISSTHLTPWIVITILLTIFPVLYFTSMWLFCIYQFVLINPFTSFTQSPKSPSFRQPPVHSSCIWVFLSFVCSFIFWFRFLM